MSLFDEAAREVAAREQPDDPDVERVERGQSATLSTRGNTVNVAGEQVDLADVETSQPDDDGNWLSGTQTYGRPRGTDALEARQIVQTSAMQSIANAITSQITGGDLAFEGVEDVMEDLSDAEQAAAGDLRTVMRDVLTGPHLQDETLDDLIAAAVEDMLGPGEAVWQLIPSESGDLPVAAMTTLDPLTIRKNINENGQFETPKYWQATSAFAGGSMAQLSSVDPVPLQAGDLAIMSYPLGNRSWNGVYPVSPSWQVKEWLEILANSTQHHSHYYDDNEIPAGLIQVVGASGNTVEDIKSKIEESSGDPRSVPVVGGEGGAQWIEMGGTAVNLDVISEQEWFFELCLGAIGLGKAELGMIEDVNRANGAIESQRVFKRVTGPFIQQFTDAFKQIARQFDAYRELGEPFDPVIHHSDPRQERAREERLRQQVQDGVITPKQYARRLGDDEIAEDDDRWTVEVAGETINYGDHPRWVTKRLFTAAGAGLNADDDPDLTPDDDGDEQAFRHRATYEVGDETLDLTPPDYMVAAAEAGREKKSDLDLGDCGTGVGERRAGQLINDEAGPDVWEEIAAYLTSHFEDVQDIDGTFSEWTDEEWADGCGPVQYALWGGTGDGRARDKAQEYANAVARARDEEEPY